MLDLTAGLGRDAALMAAAGFPVTLMERQPVLHALLTDGLARAAGTDLAARLTLLPAGEATQAALPTGPWHAVYLDPMFPTRAKSAAVKQDLQWLQTLCAYPDAEEEAALLALARARNTHRVVVKRPRKAPPWPAWRRTTATRARPYASMFICRCRRRGRSRLKSLLVSLRRGDD